MNFYMIYIMDEKIMNKYICKKCQCLQLIVDCEVISLLCIAYQGIWNAQFMFGIKIMDK
jgi:hypothetical protein